MKTAHAGRGPQTPQVFAPVLPGPAGSRPPELRTEKSGCARPRPVLTEVSAPGCRGPSPPPSHQSLLLAPAVRQHLGPQLGSRQRTVPPTPRAPTRADSLSEEIDPFRNLLRAGPRLELSMPLRKERDKTLAFADIIFSCINLINREIIECGKACGKVELTKIWGGGRLQSWLRPAS